MLFAGKWPELERETAKMRENREGAWEGSEGKWHANNHMVIVKFQKIKNLLYINKLIY